MAWSNLKTDYTDCTWEGNKKFKQTNNSDGTVSFEDVTPYTNKENSFFGANDANTMNSAINDIMNTSFTEEELTILRNAGIEV